MQTSEIASFLLRQRGTALALVVGSLSACTSAPEVPVDYCAAKHRTLDRGERLRGAIAHVLPDARARHLDHLADFAERAARSDRGATPARIAAAYLKRFPTCCTLHPPWPVVANPGWFRGNIAFDEIYRPTLYRFAWVYDVWIETDPGRPPGRFRTELMTDTCGAFGKAIRG